MLPSKIAQGTSFAKLGDTKWESSDLSEDEWSYGCVGDNDNQLLEDDKGSIVVEYDAIGGKNDVKYITVEYTATRFKGLDASEMEQRKRFVDFLSKISKHYFDQELPKSVTDKLLGPGEYTKTSTGTQVGSGFINFTISLPTKMFIGIDVHFFENKESFEKYKDS